MMKSFSALLVPILLSIAHVAGGSNSGGFLSQADCNGSTFKFVDILEVGPDPDYIITVTPIMSGLCPTSSGQMKNSTLNLNTCLGNNDAHLYWKKNGMFQTTCGCSLQIPNLCCGCERTNGSTVPSGICIDLDQGVAANGGQLNCDNLPSNN
ncbi:hypothetical protein DSL72_003652 [Monilinia vaccinii-corymbosi]|uniref:Cyanovirin-N domain-containing protein n=1 Tax=Monilinia vaccinii-corymbosi TaxID=61207 RepID=A0A8A3P2W8_9HELO|nr:hypothetical protein DSL72_003652 [Monilinia vaccinii-corymbosi]